MRTGTALGTGHMWFWCVAAHCYWSGVAGHSIPTCRGSSAYTGFVGFNVHRVMAGCTPRRGTYRDCPGYRHMWLWCVAAHQSFKLLVAAHMCEQLQTSKTMCALRFLGRNCFGLQYTLVGNRPNYCKNNLFADVVRFLICSF